MKEPQYINLTHTKALMAVISPLVFVLFFFFSLQSNKEKLEGNTASIEKLEARMESMSDLLQENNTNIKLLQLQLSYMSEKMSGNPLPTGKE